MKENHNYVFSREHNLQDTMALVSLETASSTENLRSLRNHRIMSSSSLPFLPVGRPGCSLASRSLTSTTSFTREGSNHRQINKSIGSLSYTSHSPLLMARDTNQRSRGGRNVRGAEGHWCPALPHWVGYLGGGGETTGPRRGGAAAAHGAPGEAP